MGAWLIREFQTDISRVRQCHHSLLLFVITEIATCVEFL
jgi:hypothetical protein